MKNSVNADDKKFEVIVIKENGEVRSRTFYSADDEDEARFQFAHEILAVDEAAYHAMEDYDFDCPSNAYRSAAVLHCHSRDVLIRTDEIELLSIETAKLSFAVCESKHYKTQRASKKGFTMNKKQTLAEQAAARDAGKQSISGDFVRSGQTMADKEGFSAVSRSWWAKTKPVDGVVDALIADSEECLDLEVEPNHIHLDDDGTLTLDGEKLKFGQRALGNLCEWAKVPTGVREALLNEGDEDGTRLFAEIINRGFRLHLGDRENDLKLRLRGTTVRAVVSHQYASIENGWTMETLSDIIPDARVSHFRYDGDTMSGLLLIPDTIREEKDSDYGGGIHFKNSEVGTATLYIRPSVFRSICMNGCIWGQLKGESYVSKKHSGTIDFKQVATDIHTIINEQIPLTSKCIDQMLETQSISLGNRIDCLKVIASFRPGKGVSLTQSLRRAWADGWVEEGADDTSAFGLIQGLTRAARDCRDAANAVSLETLAGDMVQQNSKSWDIMLKDAENRIDEDELLRILSEPLVNEALA